MLQKLDECVNTTKEDENDPDCAIEVNLTPLLQGKSDSQVHYAKYEFMLIQYTNHECQQISGWDHKRLFRCEGHQSQEDIDPSSDSNFSGGQMDENKKVLLCELSHLHSLLAELLWLPCQSFLQEVKSY